MPKVSLHRPKMVGLSNDLNRPKANTLDDVYEHVFASIVDQRLPPGTKLNELTLCEIFNLGRRHVSQVLFRLSYDRLLTLHPNRGAFVAAPDAAEAREIFDARKAIEPEIIRAVAARTRRADLALLRQNVEREAVCRRNGLIREAIHLSGQFHLLLGDLSDNAILTSLVRQLVARTSLVVSLYENQNSMSCWHADHETLLKHLENGRVTSAVSLMRSHLGQIEQNLDLDRRQNATFDLRAAFVPDARR
jgi:DNA-binding GntR family transcriptional regulator